MLLNYIDSMCEGPIDLSDKIYGNEIEYETNYMNHKTLTIEKLEKIISDNFRYPSLSDEENIEVSIVLPKPNSEISDELTKLISEYSKFKDNNFKRIYLGSVNLRYIHLCHSIR